MGRVCEYHKAWRTGWAGVGGTAKPELQGDWRVVQGCGGLHRAGGKGYEQSSGKPQAGVTLDFKNPAGSFWWELHSLGLEYEGVC